MGQRMVSYAQNGEDVVLRRAFGDKATGVYVDLGANHPTVDSVTKHFYDRGWRGVNVEPVPSVFETLAAERPEDVNLNVAVGRERGTATFYEAPNDDVSSFSLEHVLAQGFSREELTVREVVVQPLQQIFDEHLAGREVDFLKIDVEGAEEDAVAGLDWEGYRPRVVVLEAVREEPDGHAGGAAQVLRDARYEAMLWDGINTFWVRRESAAELREALSRPASTVLDAYDPWHYVHQILQAREDGRLEIERLQALLEEERAKPTGLARLRSRR